MSWCSSFDKKKLYHLVRKFILYIFEICLFFRHVINTSSGQDPLSIGQEPQGTIDKLEVCFYLKPSFRLMIFIKYVLIILF